MAKKGDKVDVGEKQKEGEQGERERKPEGSRISAQSALCSDLSHKSEEPQCVETKSSPPR